MITVEQFKALEAALTDLEDKKTAEDEADAANTQAQANVQSAQAQATAASATSVASAQATADALKILRDLVDGLTA